MCATDWAWIGNCYRGCASILAVFATLAVADGSRREAVNGSVRRVVVKLQSTWKQLSLARAPASNQFLRSRLFISSVTSSPVVSPLFLAFPLPSLSRRFITQLRTWRTLYANNL